MTESLQNKNKITKLPKKEAGGDEKHVYFFTRPSIPCLPADRQCAIMIALDHRLPSAHFK